MAEHIPSTLLSISLLVAVVIKGLMICGSKCHQKNSAGPVCDGYVNMKGAEVDRLVAIMKTNDNWLSCKVSKIVRKIKTKWLVIGHIGFHICKNCSVLLLYNTGCFNFKFITALAIMQDFQDNKKKKIKNGRQSAILFFISAKFVIWVIFV